MVPILLAATLLLPQAPDEPPQVPAGLPPLVRTAAGDRIDSVDRWRERRSEVLERFQREVYGRTPRLPPIVHELVDERPALDGAAVRSRVAVRFGTGEGALTSELLVFRPADDPKAPLFLGLNFRGNHTVIDDTDLPVPATPDGAPQGLARPAPESDRGVRARRYPVARVIERGYGFATAWYGELDPDFDDGFRNGLHPLWNDRGERPADAPGAIAAWARGLSAFRQVLAELGTPTVAVFGHSRLGKTALWAGATDPAFALVISNNSGCGGAALSMRRSGETVEAITRRFPHWFCKRFHRYADRERDLPVDQHLLIASIAPRPVYVASASEDAWADPLGEFLAAREASPVWALFGHAGLTDPRPPEPDTSVGGHVGYHLRTGRHDLTAADWEHFFAFADRHLRR